MTKKHFIALADFIKANPEINTPLVVQRLAQFCASQNDRFDTRRFLDYVAKGDK